MLREHLAAALAGQGSLVLIGGEAGIGKSALAEALGVEAAAQGALVVTGHCYEDVVNPPYGPWQEAGVKLRDLVTPVEALAAIPLPDPATQGSRESLFTQARAFLAALTPLRPVVIVLEDLQWADLGSLDFLRFLSHSLRDWPLLLIATYRPDELPSTHPLSMLLPQLVREAHAARLAVHRLSERDVRALVRLRYRLPAADAWTIAAYLHNRTEGNPLFVNELLQTFEEGGLLTRATDGGWHLGEMTDTPVPILLRQVILERLARLGDASPLLTTAAVIGQHLSLALWRAVTGADEERLFVAAEQAEAAGLIEAVKSADGLRFRHVLIRDALYESIPVWRRRRLH